MRRVIKFNFLFVSILVLSVFVIIPKYIFASSPEIITVAYGFDRSFDDSQKFISVGTDGFVRFVYLANSANDLHFVRCTNINCSTKVDTIVVTDPDGVDGLTIRIASDGFARIVYESAYQNIHFITCTNPNCSTNTNNIVDTISSRDYYEIGFALDTSNLASIVYTDFNSSNIRFAHCTVEDCSSVTTNNAVSFTDGTNYGVAMGEDGLARFSYGDFDPGFSTYGVHFVKCTSADCTTNVDTSLISGLPGAIYYNDMVLGSDGFGRVVYEESGAGQFFAQCTNASCSTSTITQIDSGATNQNSIVLGQDGFPRISYSGSSVGGYTISYTKCGNASCSSKTTSTASSTVSYLNSIALGLDGFSRILFANLDVDTLYVVFPEGYQEGTTPPVSDSASEYSPQHFSNGPIVGSYGVSNGQVPYIVFTPPRPQIIYPDGRIEYLDGTTTPTYISSTTAIHSLIHDLTLGSIGQDVLELQHYLNTHGYILTSIGVGSPDQETTVFGNLTKKALSVFQKANGITPAVGYFGPKTREVINANK